MEETTMSRRRAAAKRVRERRWETLGYQEGEMEGKEVRAQDAAEMRQS